jgi:hypothetical protein
MRTQHIYAVLCFVLLLTGCIGDTPSSDEDPIQQITLHPLVDDLQFSPVTANVRALDIDSDGVDEVVFTEPIAGRIGWVEADCILTTCEENVIENLGAPVRASVADLNADGHPELIVADIGILYPSNEKRGRVLTVQGNTTTVLIEGLGRTVCAEPADLDGDNDLDLTICEFGHDNGSVSWLEQEGDGNWTLHLIDNRAGSIHAYPTDIDLDGDMDIIASVSQNSEDVMLYWNDGAGNFHNTTLYDATEYYYGMSGLHLRDLDGDNDTDIVFTNGDTFDYDIPDGVNPNQLHGVAWLENDGTANFTYHDLIRTWGVYDTVMYDYDYDGDEDMLVISYQIENQFDTNIVQNQFIILEYQEGTWSPVPVETNDNFRILSATNVNGTIIAGSHDPAELGGTLHRLAALQFTQE